MASSLCMTTPPGSHQFPHHLPLANSPPHQFHEGPKPVLPNTPIQVGALWRRWKLKLGALREWKWRLCLTRRFSPPSPASCANGVLYPKTPVTNPTHIRRAVAKPLPHSHNLRQIHGRVARPPSGTAEVSQTSPPGRVFSNPKNSHLQTGKPSGDQSRKKPLISPGPSPPQRPS